MNVRFNNNGFAVVEGIMVAVGLVIVIALGVAFYSLSTKQNVSTESQTSTQPTVTEIKSPSDLDAVSTDLDQLDLEDADDSTQLDIQQAAF